MVSKAKTLRCPGALGSSDNKKGEAISTPNISPNHQ